MSETLVRPFEPEDLEFFGAITASISHELKNVATIINESAGLLHDLSVGAESGRRPLDPSRIKKMSADIARNVERMVAIMNRMNRFAHSVDEPKRSVDLMQVVGDTVALATRFASVRGVELRLIAGNEPLMVQTYVFGMHRALFTGVQHVVEDVEGVMPAEVCVSKEGHEAVVSMHRGEWVGNEGIAIRRESLTRVMQVLGGGVEFTEDLKGRKGVTLRVPAE